MGLDWRFLLKYLAITMGKTGSGVDKFIPQAKGTTTLHSLVTNETSNQFWDSEANPDFMAEEEKELWWNGHCLKALTAGMK